MVEGRSIGKVVVGGTWEESGRAAESLSLS